MRPIFLRQQTPSGGPRDASDEEQLQGNDVIAAVAIWRRRFMKALIGAVLVVAFVTPALAADEFYVVQDVKTKKCTIVDKKPTTTTETTVVGNGVYKTRTEAETGMKSVKVCTTN
jgi:hypothetical protein